MSATGMGNNLLNSQSLERVHHLGVGWSTNIPLIVSDTCFGYTNKHLFFNGNVYELDQGHLAEDNPLRSNILGYDLTDLRIFQSQGRCYQEDSTLAIPTLTSSFGLLPETNALRSKYVLTLKTNEKYWFKESGQLMLAEDRSGLNKIWYFYDTANRLRLVVDSVGRQIVFSYDSNNNLTALEWEVKHGAKASDGTRQYLTSGEKIKRSIHYGYTSAESLACVATLKTKVSGYQTPYILTTVTDAMGLVTQYEYREGLAGFTFDEAHYALTQNAWLLLSTVTGIYTEANGKYKNKRYLEYRVPEKGLYTKAFYSGKMEHFKLTRQYDVDRHGSLLNDTAYTYCGRKRFFLIMRRVKSLNVRKAYPELLTVSVLKH